MGVSRRLAALHRHTRSSAQPLAPAAPAPTYNESDSGAIHAALRAHLPIPVDGSGAPDPSALDGIRQAMRDAAALEDYRLAKGFADLLFVAEPRPLLTL